MEILLNPVLLAVAALLLLAAMRLNVVFSLILAALIGGLAGGMGLEKTVNAFFADLTGGAVLALNYVMLGALSVAIAQSGIIEWLADALFRRADRGGELSEQQSFLLKYTLFGVLTLISMSSQNLIPVHIAFIPILIPPLLALFDRLRIDRRAVACILTFGLITPYMVLPFGFGKIYLNDLLLKNVVKFGLPEATAAMVMPAMLIPAGGMVAGLLIAVFLSYRKPRIYNVDRTLLLVQEPPRFHKSGLFVGIAAILTALAGQCILDKMAFAALAGILVFLVTGQLKLAATQDLFARGVQMMGGIGVVMIAASGFAGVITATGGVDELVGVLGSGADGSRALLVFLMLLIGLIVTLGIGSSFATIPILAMIYVPLCREMGLSPLATLAIVGTAGALGDAGSPVSESVLGPTAGLNADGQHDHIRDSVIPTFLHYNLPLLVAGWIAGMVL